MRDRNETPSVRTIARLRGLAYRILGSRADADDAVQDTLLQWHKADRTGIENPDAWLTTVCTRLCIDLLRSAHRTRVDYVGPWLPEPVLTQTDPISESSVELASSLSTAFLLMLERLTPKERAAYLLHDIFDLPYLQVAQTLELNEAACRRLVSRARNSIAVDRVRYLVPADRQQRLLEAFQSAVASGQTASFAALLSEDVELRADSGGRVAAVSEIVAGSDHVTRFVGEGLHRYWRDCEWRIADINGNRGAIIAKDDAIVAVVSLSYNPAGQLTGIYIMRNPQTLERFGKTTVI
ncbi:RNA polymerase sigma factor SigJ [Pseudorhodoplanes sp.]|uniref:RNA polymerase sigma factor SigJ n=1 Tax=Pseudorhodoplanes sp. TaxID=1934341 RepID=UPI00391CB199